MSESQSDGLDFALSKIRPQTASSLEHQKAPATLLHAIEAAIDERKTERSPTAYFAALLTALGGTLQNDASSGLALDEGDMLPAELYLLALVAPFVPTPVIRGNLNTILSLTSPLFPSLMTHPPPLRSQIGLYGSVLKALDGSQLDVQGVRQSFASVLQLCLDARPKVRKRAAEVITDVLSSPPTPLVRHPYSDRVAEWVKSTLTDVVGNAVSRSKHSPSNTDAAEVALHLLSFLRQVVLRLPPSPIYEISTYLSSLPSLGNPFLSQSAYSILSDVLSANTKDDDFNVVLEIPQILKALLSYPPEIDNAIAPVWLGLLGNGLLTYKNADPRASAGELGEVWKAVWAFLESSDVTIRKACYQSLTLLAQCLTPETIRPAMQEHGQFEPRSTLGRIVLEAEKAFKSLAFARSVSELLLTVSALISNLRYREAPAGPTAAEVLLLPLVQRIGSMRTEKNFEHKGEADRVLSQAIGTMGPAALLNALPLNLEPADRQAGREPRAFLLPLLAQPHPSPLRHFVSYFVPLSERMFNLQQNAESESRQSEAKVWTVLIAQIWAGLPGYCWPKADTQEAFTTAFSQMLSQILYTQVELRSFVLRALTILVDSNVAIASQDPSLLDKLPSAVRMDCISQDQAAKNVDFLRKQAESWLAVLFNVFGSFGREAQGMVGEVITTWLGIAGETTITQGYRKVFDLFGQNLKKSRNTRASTDTSSILPMTLDILVLLLPYLSIQDASELFDAIFSEEVLVNPDNAVQKRGYKILARLVEGRKLPVDAEPLIKRLDELSDGLSPAAKKDRLQLYANLLSSIPPSALHVIPLLIPEAVLGTKEPSEKARGAAFELIIAMGRKMAEGGVVKRNLVDGMDEDGEGEAKASLEEYVTMIAAGLAGATPHMISATVTAISRLVFEFKDAISVNMLNEIVATLLVFLSSANREIVKSTLGFIKLAVHVLPESLMRPQLHQLVPALLGWAHDHKNHFKVKVRHIFERMIRRFGFQEVYSCSNGEESAKVLVNIKKRKDRAKRKKSGGANDEVPPKKSTTGDAFEDVLYASESDLSDSDEEEEAATATSGKRRGGNFAARLRIDDDEPMDLLSGAASRFTNARGGRQPKHRQDAAHFKMDEETGKMIVEESDSDVGGVVEPDVAGTAYREALTSADGFTRGPGGRIKFNKDTKKRRRENAVEDEDVEMAETEPARTTGKKRNEVKLGHEFRAKKAGGDLKKGRLDPYAYVSLKQAAKKGNRRSRLGVAGKR